MKPLGIDPGAELRLDIFGRIDSELLVEAVLERLDDGRLVLTLDDELGDELASVTLRADFLDAAIAARAREAAA